MRKSISSQSMIPSNIPRRASSIDAQAIAGRHSILSNSQLMQTSARQSMQNGRLSVLGSSAAASSSQAPPRRSSSASQPRMSMSSGKMGGGKTDEAPSLLEMAQTLFKILETELQYPQPLSVKMLTTPSIATFYTLFEYLLNNLGIFDVYNTNVLPKDTLDKMGGGQGAKNMNNAMANKLKIEVVLYHLNVLKYNVANMPKPNVLQSLTPKNWFSCLHILLFLGHNVHFKIIYTGEKLMQLFNHEDRVIIFDYLQCAFSCHKTDPHFAKSEKHEMMKAEAVEKYKEKMFGEQNLKILQQENEHFKRRNEELLSTVSVLDDLQLEEQELTRIFNEHDKQLRAEIEESNEKFRRNKQKKKELSAARSKLDKDEQEKLKKDKLYDLQIASGKQLDNVGIRASQKQQELENAQNAFIDLEKKTDELHSKLMMKTQEVKDAISMSNELVNKIKLSSSLTLKEFPQLDLIDLHQQGGSNIIREYKDSVLDIRGQYNRHICDLPELIMQQKEEKKMIEKKIENAKTLCNQLEKDFKRVECSMKEYADHAQEIKHKENTELESVRRELDRCQEEVNVVQEDVNKIKQSSLKVSTEQAKIEADIQIQLKQMEDSLEENKQQAKTILADVHAKNSGVVDNITKQLKQDITQIYKIFNIA